MLVSLLLFCITCFVQDLNHNLTHPELNIPLDSMPFPTLYLQISLTILPLFPSTSALLGHSALTTQISPWKFNLYYVTSDSWSDNYV